jgi:Leucine-rich repeat (LRR) protein
MSELDRILRGPASPMAWQRLVELLDPWPRSVGLGEVEHALADWPSSFREATSAGWEAALAGSPPPWWPLVRHVQLGPLDRIESVEPLALVTSLAFDPEDNEFPVDWLAELPQLEVLDLSGVEGLSSFTEIPVLPALHTVIARGCPYLDDLGGLDAQPALRTLDLSASFDCLELATLPPLPALEVLRFDSTPSLDDLAPLAALIGLTELDLSGCRGITELAPLAACGALQLLNLAGIPRLRDATPLGQLGELRELWLDGEALADLHALVKLPLEELILARAATVDTRSIAALRNLDVLHLADLAELSLGGLTGSRVSQLFVVRCARIGELDALAGLAEVSRLHLDALPQLGDLTAIGAMPSLTELQIRDCAALSDVSGLASARGLELLLLHDCPDVVDMSAIEALPALRRIDVTGLPAADGLADLKARIKNQS